MYLIQKADAHFLKAENILFPTQILTLKYEYTVEIWIYSLTLKYESIVEIWIYSCKI